MQALVVAVVLGSVVSLVSCKPIAREPESRPEVFGSVPKHVKAFLKAINKPRGSFRSGKLLKLREEHPEVLKWTAEHGDYSTFKQTFDAADRLSVEKMEDMLDHVIYYAAKSPDSDMKIKYLIEKGGSIHGAIDIAALRGNLDAIKVLTSKTNNYDFEGWLMIAAQSGHYEVVEYMLKHKPNNIEEVANLVKQRRASLAKEKRLRPSILSAELTTVELLLRKTLRDNAMRLSP